MDFDQLRGQTGSGRRLWLRWIGLVIGIGLFACCTAYSLAEIPSANDSTGKSPAKAKPTTNSKTVASDDVAKAESLVKDALFHEIYGDADTRDRLLKEARQIAPDFSPALWHSGLVQFQNRWMTNQEWMNSQDTDKRLASYVSHRDRASDTEAGQLRLAQWCESRGLYEQARAHFNAVLEYNPNNLTARTKLGHRQIGGQWVTQAEFERRTTEQVEHEKALRAWVPKIAPLVVGMFSSGENERKMSHQQFSEIKDAGAIPAMEYCGSLINEEIAHALVEKLSQWSELAATKALSRQAIYSPWETVRQSAALKLRGRPREAFVPQMLAALQSQIEKVSSIGASIDRTDPAAGQINYREVFLREGQDSKDVETRTTVYHVSAKGNGNRTDAINQAALVMRLQRAMEDASVALQNLQTSEVNRRVMDCLANATEHIAFVSPDDWWYWWDQENETKYATEKPSRTSYLQRDVVVEDDRYLPPTVTGSDWYAPPPRHHSCFTAGTLVWTLGGPKMIEQMRVGDLVLSQNPDSGEVAYKPVLRTTVRPGSEVFAVETSGGTLNATGGHLFWIAGEGWTKARNLKSGQTLHCATGTVQVSDVSQQAAPKQTYNLVVADFNTYFVGAEKILSHDVTDRKPTRSIVPGLPRE